MATFGRIDAERIYLRPYQPGDFDAMMEYQGLPEVVRFIPWPVRDEVLVREALNKGIMQVSLDSEGDYLVLAIVQQSDDKVIGQVNAMYRSLENKSAEFGYAINPVYGGNGYVSEACEVLISALFATGLFHRVFAKIDARNAPSEGVLKRLNLRKEAHHIQDDFFKGEWTDTIIYAVLKDEWLARI